MLGAIIGDTVGSRFEWHNIHTKEFKLLPNSCFLTDDSIMTIAVAEAILNWVDDSYREKNDYSKLSEYAALFIRKWGKMYPKAGYGGSFRRWLRNPSLGPYNSCGNGAAMRISPVGWASENLEDCVAMSKAITRITHDHPDGIMGAESTAVQIFQATHGIKLNSLKEYEKNNYYQLNYNLEWLQKNYTWHSLCNGTCQAAFVCLYESTSFEDAIRNCISIGGDCDTTAAICGGIAEAVWGIPESISSRIIDFMDYKQKQIVFEFQNRFINKK